MLFVGEIIDFSYASFFPNCKVNYGIFFLGIAIKLDYFYSSIYLPEALYKQVKFSVGKVPEPAEFLTCLKLHIGTSTLTTCFRHENN